MHFVCKINKGIYRCITKEISSDEVIITDERIRHIKARRGNAFYETYREYFPKIIAEPDYIFADKKPHTALVCKSFGGKEEVINLVIRIAVFGDNPNYKNSVITAIKENRKRFEQRLRNNVPLYKNE